MNATLSALLLTVSMTASASIIYQDPALLNANWQSTVVLQQGGTTLTFTDSSGAGNPDLYSLAVVNIPFLPAGTTSQVAVARTRSDFSWNPSTDGALDTMRFELDARNFSSSGFSRLVALPYRPVIMQGGNIFSLSPSVNLSPTPGGSFETLVWELSSTSGWFGSTNPNLLPDFSTNGGIITFGFRIGIGGSCSSASTTGCAVSTVTDGIDNFRVTLAAASPSEVPEPGTWTLVSAAGLACFAFKKRRA